MKAGFGAVVGRHDCVRLSEETILDDLTTIDDLARFGLPVHLIARILKQEVLMHY